MNCGMWCVPPPLSLVALCIPPLPPLLHSLSGVYLLRGVFVWLCLYLCVSVSLCLCVSVWLPLVHCRTRSSPRHSNRSSPLRSARPWSASASSGARSSGCCPSRNRSAAPWGMRVCVYASLVVFAAAALLLILHPSILTFSFVSALPFFRMCASLTSSLSSTKPSSPRTRSVSTSAQSPTLLRACLRWSA